LLSVGSSDGGPSCSIVVREFLDCLTDYQHLKHYYATWSYIYSGGKENIQSLQPNVTDKECSLCVLSKLNKNASSCLYSESLLLCLFIPICHEEMNHFSFAERIKGTRKHAYFSVFHNLNSSSSRSCLFRPYFFHIHRRSSSLRAIIPATQISVDK